MRIDVLTLFPEMFTGVFETSILGKAQDKGIVSLSTVNFRDFSGNKHNTVDDMPYGGGGGMVLKAEPIFNAVEHLLEDPSGQATGKKPRIILMCPQGKPFSQDVARELAAESHLIFICGHYEGYDERIREFLVTEELSVGDYVLTGGELPAMVVVDAVVRLLPGVLGNDQSAVTDSFSDGLLEYPHYTRPAEFRGWKVPDTLLSGHHAEIVKWRRKQSLERTLVRRPELLEQAELTPEERKWLRTMRIEREQTTKPTK
ncbi:tRNA (guanosine(37)-N1)-methyltransferase TrmD [Cohnella luojiensis]|uniref:tRNA (guanine-N(1)-)-methyltransferase n=1 Tax=Cohnella luojiensis TaxID=652876 RepID=A0A4Y8M007_9BACL|nr:tRNA (guanosine(37)-N1)-methyltransferase TrmD [Cohnella luojiensis]TFE25019.1 tRNA (guanosine(37)-N1)-methyltransferase TrmD [Cohnella luojiensis]